MPNEKHDPSSGQFTSGGGSGSKTPAGGPAWDPQEKAQWEGAFKNRAGGKKESPDDLKGTKVASAAAPSNHPPMSQALQDKFKASIAARAGGKPKEANAMSAGSGPGRGPKRSVGDSMPSRIKQL